MVPPGTGGNPAREQLLSFTPENWGLRVKFDDSRGGGLIKECESIICKKLSSWGRVGLGLGDKRESFIDKNLRM